MSGLMALEQLNQAGLLSFTDDGFPTSTTTFVLTQAGVALTTGPRHSANDDEISVEPRYDQLGTLY